MDITQIKLRFRRTGGTAEDLNWYLREVASFSYPWTFGDTVDSGTFNTGDYVRHVWSDLIINVNGAGLSGDYFFSIEPPHQSTQFNRGVRQCELSADATQPEDIVIDTEGISVSQYSEQNSDPEWDDGSSDYFIFAYNLYFDIDDAIAHTVGPADGDEYHTLYSSTQLRNYGILISVEAGVPEKATTPEPGDDTDGWTTEWPTLTWEDGGAGADNAATSYDVYFKKGFLGSLELVASGIEETSFTMPDHTGDDLDELTEYTWRVDSINDGGTTTGDEWTFTTSGVRGLGKPRDPVPADSATGQSVNLSEVSFGDGEGALSYNVYFGTPGNLTLLENVSTDSQSASTAYQSLLKNTTYNWRVDAVNSLGTVTGDVWEFTTTSNFNPPNPTDFKIIRKIIAAAKNRIYIEDI